jgi:hypothetical protein
MMDSWITVGSRRAFIENEFWGVNSGFYALFENTVRFPEL